ncbi:MAG: TetR/AcrR family transcriptional regulator [Labilithrix sp.]|nr:TetR/AcrR family transcriptional regulator [Labilithrix sp.]
MARAARRQPSATRREPRVPKRETSQETRSALLDATEAILRAEGAAAVTTTRVAKQAGLSVGTVYEYFPSKERLVMAVEERSWTGVTEKIMENAPALVQGKSPRDAARAIIAFCVSLLRERIELHGFTRDTEETRALRRQNVEKTARYMNAFFTSLGLVPTVAEPQFSVELAVVIVINATRLGTLYWSDRMDAGSFQDEVADMIVKHLFGPA